MKKDRIADVLSLLRVPAAVAVATLGVMEMWVPAFIVLTLGWLTDAADGMAARKWGSYRTTHSESDVDGWCDIPLCFLGSAVPVAYYMFMHPAGYGWVLGVLYIASVISGGLMVWLMDKEQTPLQRRVIAVNMTVFHLGLQIVATLAWFAYMALGGWAAFAVALAFTLPFNGFAGENAFKAKLRCWMQGELTSPKK